MTRDLGSERFVVNASYILAMEILNRYEFRGGFDVNNKEDVYESKKVEAIVNLLMSMGDRRHGELRRRIDGLTTSRKPVSLYITMAGGKK